MRIYASILTWIESGTDYKSVALPIELTAPNLKISEVIHQKIKKVKINLRSKIDILLLEVKLSDDKSSKQNTNKSNNRYENFWRR